MIEIRGVSKRFEGTDALRRISITMPTGEVFGLVGTNGAGKSTLLRLIAGVLRPDEGEILIDGEPVWEREEVKAKIALIPDDAYFFPNATAVGMAEFYASARPAFDRARFDDLLRRFGLEILMELPIAVVIHCTAQEPPPLVSPISETSELCLNALGTRFPHGKLTPLRRLRPRVLL